LKVHKLKCSHPLLVLLVKATLLLVSVMQEDSVFTHRVTLIIVKELAKFLVECIDHMEHWLGRYTTNISPMNDCKDMIEIR